MDTTESFVQKRSARRFSARLCPTSRKAPVCLPPLCKVYDFKCIPWRAGVRKSGGTLHRQMDVPETITKRTLPPREGPGQGGTWPSPRGCTTEKWLAFSIMRPGAVARSPQTGHRADSSGGRE
jgi:hypothetical protein